MSSSPTARQNHFRFRTDADDADTGTPTWGAAEDVNYTPALDTPFRIRFAVDNTGTGGTTAPTNILYSKNGGAYTAITTSSTNVKSVVASSSADNATIATANFKLTAGSGTAATGMYDESGSAANSIVNGNYKEIEYGLQLLSANLAAGDTVDFRVYGNGGATAFTTYNVTPRCTVPAGSQSVVPVVMSQYRRRWF